MLRRKPQLQNSTGWFVANLAIADLGVCIINMPISAVCALADSFPFPNFLCLATGFTNSAFCGASIVLLALVSVDRSVTPTKSCVVNSSTISALAKPAILLSPPLLDFLLLFKSLDVVRLVSNLNLLHLLMDTHSTNKLKNERTIQRLIC